jgi:hypothetical protein
VLRKIGLKQIIMANLLQTKLTSLVVGSDSALRNAASSKAEIHRLGF